MLTYPNLTPGTLLPGGIVCDHALGMFADDHRIARDAEITKREAAVVALKTWIAMRKRELREFRARPAALDIEIDTTPRMADVIAGFRRLR